MSKNERQGRRKDQVQFSEEVAYWSIIVIIAIIVILLITR
jgi:cell division protein FtsL